MIEYFGNLACENALEWPKLVDKLEEAMAGFSTGKIVQPVRVMLPVTEHEGFLGKTKCCRISLHSMINILYSCTGLMPCYSEADNVIACKVLGIYPKNKQYDMPSHIVYVFLFDASNGNLLAMLVRRLNSFVIKHI